VLGQARQIGEPKIDLLGALFRGESDYFFRGHFLSSPMRKQITATAP
jgi:hypothetical protein